MPVDIKILLKKRLFKVKTAVGRKNRPAGYLLVRKTSSGYMKVKNGRFYGSTSEQPGSLTVVKCSVRFGSERAIFFAEHGPEGIAVII